MVRVILIMGRLAGSFFYLDPIGLGNGPHVLGNEKVEYKITLLGLYLLWGRLGWVICLSWPNWVR